MFFTILFPTLIINCQISNFLGSYSSLVLQCLFCTWESKGVRNYEKKSLLCASWRESHQEILHLEKQRLGVFCHFSLFETHTFLSGFLSEKTWLWVVCLFFKKWPVQLPQSNNEFVVKTWCYLDWSCGL